MSPRVQELAAAISPPLKDPNLAEKLGAAGPQLVRKRHTADRNVAFIELLYVGAVNEHQGWYSGTARVLQRHDGDCS